MTTTKTQYDLNALNTHYEQQAQEIKDGTRTEYEAPSVMPTFERTHGYPENNISDTFKLLGINTENSEKIEAITEAVTIELFNKYRFHPASDWTKELEYDMIEDKEGISAFEWAEGVSYEYDFLKAALIKLVATYIAL